MAVTNYWFSHSMNLLHYLLCFFFEFYDIDNKTTINVSIIRVIMPLGSSSFTGAFSGENGGVTNLTSINVPTSNAFPMIPT